MKTNPSQHHSSILKPIDPAQQDFNAYTNNLRKQGYGWWLDGLGEWETEAIFEQLVKLGVDTSVEKFSEQARLAGRCKTLDQIWYRQVKLEDEIWGDFIFFASIDLWKRLTPDLHCPEILADRLDEIINWENERAENSSDECKIDPIRMALNVVNYLERFPVEQRADRFKEIVECGQYEYGSWILELILQYGREYADEMVRIARIMADCEQPDNFLGDMACVLAEAGQRSEAIQQVEANLQRFPDDIWIKIKSGDVYQTLNDEQHGDRQKAIDLYTEALQKAQYGYDWDGAEERLYDIYHEMNEPDKMDELRRLYPQPDKFLNMDMPDHTSQGDEDNSWLDDEPDSAMIEDDWDDDSTAPIVRGERKIGRNESCPCGSGKKYKKCCLNRGGTW